MNIELRILIFTLALILIPTLYFIFIILIATSGIVKISGNKNNNVKARSERNVAEADMEELANVIRKFENLENLVAVIEEGEEIETVEDLVEYLEDELSYAD